MKCYEQFDIRGISTVEIHENQILFALTGVAREYNWTSATPRGSAFSALGPDVAEFILAHLLPASALSNNPVILVSGAHAASDIVDFNLFRSKRGALRSRLLTELQCIDCAVKCAEIEITTNS